MANTPFLTPLPCWREAFRTECCNPCPTPQCCVLKAVFSFPHQYPLPSSSKKPLPGGSSIAWLSRAWTPAPASASSIDWQLGTSPAPFNGQGQPRGSDRRPQPRQWLRFQEAGSAPRSSAGLGMCALTLDLPLPPGSRSSWRAQVGAALLSPSCDSPYKKRKEFSSPSKSRGGMGRSPHSLQIPVLSF